jgi:hypothetical protein
MGATFIVTLDGATYAIDAPTYAHAECAARKRHTYALAACGLAALDAKAHAEQVPASVMLAAGAGK